MNVKLTRQLTNKGIIFFIVNLTVKDVPTWLNERKLKKERKKKPLNLQKKEIFTINRI